MDEIHLDDLEKIGDKPVLVIKEHQELQFIKDEKNSLFLTESDTIKKDELEGKKIKIHQTENGILISTNYYVAIQEFSGFILKVIPKVIGDIDTLGRMLAFCYMNKDFFLKNEKIRFQEDGPLEMTIMNFFKLCQELIKKELYKKYVTYTDNVSYLKGKLLIKQQIQNTMKFNMKFHCKYDEFTSNNLENQIILHTLKKCLVISKNKDLTTKIQKLIHHMDKQIEDKEIVLSDFNRIHYTRLNKNYENPLVLSKLILEKTGFMNIKQMKTAFIIPFFIEMPDLFEKFIEKLFKEYSKFNVEPQYSHTAWKKDDIDSQAIEKDEKKMMPDLVIYENKLEGPKNKLLRENIKFVIDAKYMEDLNLSERYQIAFYLHEYGITSGFAICPTLESTFPNEGGQIRYSDKEAYVVKSEYQKISIYVKHINVNEFLDKCTDMPEKELQELIGNIITIKAKNNGIT